MPTTVFLLLGSYFLTRSCPALEDRLLSTRLLRPYARFVRSGAAMPRKARVIALAMMWGSIAGSAGALATADQMTAWIGAVFVAMGLIGTVAILRFRRGAAVPG